MGQRHVGAAVRDVAHRLGNSAVDSSAATEEIAVAPTYAAAFSELVERHHARLTHLAYLLCGDRALAEDCVAEAYARVWPAFKRGRVVTPQAYLRRAVVNQVNGSHRRRAVRRREEARRTTDDSIALSFDGPVLDHEVLRPALLALPITHRTIVVLRFLEDLSESETAELLDIKVGTVKSRTSRALDQLRRLIGEPE
jgi:RNA polymerase sigma-70 factor (sigma-E family)